MQSGVGKAEIPTPHIRLGPQGGSRLINSQAHNKNLGVHRAGRRPCVRLGPQGGSHLIDPQTYNKNLSVHRAGRRPCAR